LQQSKTLNNVYLQYIIPKAIETCVSEQKNKKTSCSRDAAAGVTVTNAAVIMNPESSAEPQYNHDHLSDACDWLSRESREEKGERSFEKFKLEFQGRKNRKKILDATTCAQHG
jgi:hypothetical protein